MAIANQKPKFYITTPIYYPNARPHVGSAYTTIVCDAIARYKRMCGYDVAFLTGTDEHGEKLQRAADAAGVPVAQFVAEKRELFKDLWRTLGISDYRFVHTSQNPDHVKAVHWMIQQADKAGYIEKKKYEGRYCIYDERYVSDSPEPANCDICGRPAELIREENYFFKLSAFETRLLKHYEDHPEFVLPSYRMNEVKSFVKSGLRDISISRRRLKWGIPWPDDREQVVYVWYDALTSYLTGIGFRGDERSKDFEKYWMGAEGPAEVVHMIGKDILRFHAVYWPAFLWAAGLPLPKTIFAHGWIYYEQDKMSKSKGNVVYPEPTRDGLVLERKSLEKILGGREIEEVYPEPVMESLGNDALRYYLMSGARIDDEQSKGYEQLSGSPFGQDMRFSYGDLIKRYNSGLANDFGNLANRIVAMMNMYFGGIVPERPSSIGVAEEYLR
ncbi:MAG: class I tRNA ligase family protein, partial [Terriglobia bacterium]